MKNKNKITLAIIICLLSLIPYPTKAFHPFSLKFVDENNSPMVGVKGVFKFSEYPSLNIEWVKFKLDDRGSLYLKDRLVWMSWIKRRFYNILSIISRSGWSDPSLKLTMHIPHQSVEPGKVRMAILVSNNITMEQCSSKVSSSSAATYNGFDGQFFYIENSYSEEEDVIEFYIRNSFYKTNSDIRLQMKTLDPGSIGCK